jgi:hypothetical protein
VATRSEHEIRFRSDFRQFRQGFRQAEKTVGGFGAAIGRFLPGVGGLLGVTGITRMATQFGETASKLRDLNRQTGIAIEDLQRLDFVAAQTGLNLEDMTKTYLRFIEIQERARRGQKQTEENLRALGIDPKAAGLQTPMEFMKTMAEAVQPESALGPLRLLLPELGPRFRQAAAQDIPALMARAPVSPAALIERTATAMDEMTTTLRQLQADLAPLLGEIVGLLKILSDFVNWYRSVAQSAGRASVEGFGTTSGWGNWGPMARGIVKTAENTDRIARAMEAEE